MPREIPRSRRYVTVQLPRDRDLIFRIGHNLGRRTQSCATSNITYRLNSFTARPKDHSLVPSLVRVKSPGRDPGEAWRDHRFTITGFSRLFVAEDLRNP